MKKNKFVVITTMFFFLGCLFLGRVFLQNDIATIFTCAIILHNGIVNLNFKE